MDRTVSRRAIALSLVLVTIGLSAFRWARLELGTLLVHPYLVPMFLVFGVAAVGQLGRFPRDIMIAIGLFVALYLIATLPAAGAMGEMLKVFASFTTVVTCALCVRTRADFWAATLGLNAAATIMTIKGLAAGMIAYTGYNPLDDIANKNAFSLYALPPLLLGGHVILDSTAPRRLRILLGANACLVAFSIFSGANRSGWLGLIFIAVALVARGQRLRGAAILSVVGGLIYLLLTRYGTTDVLDYRIKQTQAGYHSDERREILLETSFRIGFDNPVMGTSPQRLPYELARVTHSPEPAIDPHNVFGHIVGGCGLICAAAFLWLGVVAWRRPKLSVPDGSAARQSTQLVRIAIALFAVRGMFSREILYSPSFAASFGLCIGLCAIEYGAVVRARRRPRLAVAPSPAVAPAPGPSPDGVPVPALASTHG